MTFEERLLELVPDSGRMTAHLGNNVCGRHLLVESESSLTPQKFGCAKLETSLMLAADCRRMTTYTEVT